MTPLDEIAAERSRQIEAEGWTPEHDDDHGEGDLALAAACYAMGDYRIIGRDAEGKPLGQAVIWPWDREWWKPGDRSRSKGYRRDLVKAGALIIAEIERLDRADAALGAAALIA